MLVAGGMCFFAALGGAPSAFAQLLAPSPEGASPAPEAAGRANAEASSFAQDPLRALGVFLMALGELDDPAKVADCPFDGNDEHGPGSGNGLPDAVEFALLAEVLSTPGVDFGLTGGVAHVSAVEAYRANLARAEENLGAEAAARHPWLVAVMAAYMTIGAWDVEAFLASAVQDIAGLKVSLKGYDSSQRRHLAAKEDADNDAVTNQEEWEYTRSVSKPVQEYVRRCLDPKAHDMLPMVPLDSLRCWNDDLNNPGPQAGFLRMDTSNGGMKFRAWVKLDPEGRGIEVPPEALETGASQEIIRAGRIIELRLLPGQDKAFHYWNIPGTMADGSPKKRVVFTFVAQNGPEFVVRAEPR